MAVRRPLVSVAGRTKELPAGDALVGAGVTVAATAPGAPAEGDEWFDTTSGIQYTRVSSAWAALGNPIIVSATPPASPVEGMLWLDIS